MSLELCILASGSSGNCTILRTPGGVVLIDAGIGPRTAAKRMSGTGVSIADVGAICLTHLDRDHFSPTWFATAQKLGIRLFCHESRADELIDLHSNWRGRLSDPVSDTEPRVETFNGSPFEPVKSVQFSALKLDHDELGSHGFVIEGSGSRIGYATDLGRVPRLLLERFCDVDLLAIESNYDPQMQADSSRPWFLKRRIMGGRGHLSNQQAFEAVCEILDRCQSRRRQLPRHIVLLHRSRQCNCPRIVRALFESDDRIASRLILAEQYVRSEWLSVREAHQALIGEQLTLQM